MSTIRKYVWPKQVWRAKSRATVRFETGPGRQLQTDWGVQRTVIVGQSVEVHFVVSTLGYSCGFHFWGTDAEAAEHTYKAVVRAFEWSGGVPAEVLDHQKAAVIAHRMGATSSSSRFLDLTGHYGFRPRARRPARSPNDGTVHEVVAERRFAREAATMQQLPSRR